ncbi:MAG TPA: hypothetical protein PLV92_19610 [Pirellulaceae bacterium]|nr:hypothetical protein [Pirellulaceae bacterium]
MTIERIICECKLSGSSTATAGRAAAITPTNSESKTNCAVKRNDERRILRLALLQSRDRQGDDEDSVTSSEASDMDDLNDQSVGERQVTLGH